MSDFQASPELLTIYLEDARSHLEALDHCLLTLEREGPDPAVVSGIVGPLHTLKGNSGMMGFTAIKEYVHRLEDVFAEIADGGMTLTPAAFDQLFAGASALRDAVERSCLRRGEARDLAPEKALLDALLRQGETDVAAPATSPAPAPSAPPPAPAPAAEPPRPIEAHYIAARSTTVRVDFSQLDHLLNLVGELIIYRTKLYQLGKELAETVVGRAAGRELISAVQHVGGVSALLQETVMDIRMLPVRHVFERFPRLVRDLAREQGKEIELILEGEKTRVDKAIIDEIGEPLVHLIRNSVDHGIETPEVRVARGKTRTGTVLLSATQESSQVVITIMDDGAGIDASRVYRKAVERGILKGDETLTDREAVQLIFAQGFSTRESVTEVSGRGVGLDVVLKSIERLNGLVEVETVPGVGTKFIIQLPLTLAIISVLMVEVAGRTYAVPLSAVVETLRLEPGEIHRINNRETLRIRDRIIPVLRLAAVFGLDPGDTGERRYVVIVGRGDKRVGIVVDRLKGQQEVVIKALDPAVTGEAPVVAGATIMGDGRVVLILDVAALFEGRRQALLRGRGEAGPLALAEG
jgi:two-component system, chemotaxis family, sensor kinase CheA